MRFISCVVCSSSHELPSSALIIVPSAMRGRMNEKAAGREAKLYYMGHATIGEPARAGGSRHGPAWSPRPRARWNAPQKQCSRPSRGKGGRVTVGEDKAYDTADHVAELRVANVTPHVTQNNGTTKTGKARSSAIDARTTRHAGYGMSQTRLKQRSRAAF